MSGRFVHHAIRTLDLLARMLPDRRGAAAHLLTGNQGEEEAYFYLRREGYIIISRNYRTPRSRSELDMVGWDGETLCFIEVKTRSSKHFLPAEAAVDYDKRRDLSRVAQLFLSKIGGHPAFRFDVVSVYLSPGGEPEFVLFKNAFSMT